MMIEFGEPCIGCKREIGRLSLGHLLAIQLVAGTDNFTLCSRHLGDLRDCLNDEGFRWLDQSMRVPTSLSKVALNA